MQNDGYQKARAVASKIKEEVQQNEEQVAENNEAMKLAARQETQVTTLPDTYFQDNQNVGLEDLTPEDMPTPVLQLIQRTSKVVDDEGRPYVPGSFYYKATRKVMNEVNVSLLVFTKQDLPTYNDKNITEQVYVFLGALMPEAMPFKMFLRGSGAGAVRQFLGEVRALKKPMYTLDVTITSVKRENEFGPYFVPQFQISGVRKNAEEIVMLEDLAKTYSQNKGKIHQENAEEIANREVADTPFQ